MSVHVKLGVQSGSPAAAVSVKVVEARKLEHHSPHALKVR